MPSRGYLYGTITKIQTPTTEIQTGANSAVVTFKSRQCENCLADFCTEILTIYSSKAG